MMSSKKQTHKQPSSSASSRKSKAAPHPNPLEIQAKDLKVSGFCSPGVGTKQAGAPGGAIYEKASSRHKRHREVYKSSASGQAVAKEAVPLGGGASRRSFTNANNSSSMKRKALLEDAKKKLKRAHTK